MECRPCNHGARCRMFGCAFSHPPGRPQLCKFGTGCRKLHDAEHCQRFLHAKPSGGGAGGSGAGGSTLLCKFGAGCRKLHDPGHCQRFMHAKPSGGSMRGGGAGAGRDLAVRSEQHFTRLHSARRGANFSQVQTEEHFVNGSLVKKVVTHTQQGGRAPAGISERDCPRRLADKPDVPKPARSPAQRPAKQERLECCVCGDKHPSSKGILCTSKHFTCDGCFKHYVTMRTDTDSVDAETLRRTGAAVRCPCAAPHDIDCTAEAFSDSAVARHVDDETFGRYLRCKESLVRQQVYEEAQATLQREIAKVVDATQAKAVSEELLAEQLRRQFPNAVMCGNADCRHGPIDHGGCSCLSTHHGDAARNGGPGVINNSCRQCGWFARRITDWPKWDGVLRRS